MGEKSILIIGSAHEAALELIYSKELDCLGITNRVLGVQNVFLEYYGKSILNKILFRIGFSDVISRIQKDIKKTVTEFKPKIVLIFKGMEVTPSTLIWIKARGIQLANYNPDNPFLFSGRGSGNVNVRMSINLFDFYFTYDRNTYFRLVDSKINSVIIPFAFDSKGFVFENLKEDDEIKKICFLGNLDKQRCKFINALASNGLQIDIFGENSSNFSLHPNINNYGPKYGSDFWSTLQKYAVQLNLLRPHNFNSHNMRSFDILGAGGVMLAPRTEDHLFYFEDGVEVFLFSNFDECLKRISLLLNMNFVERSNIRAAARRKSLAKHTYSDRVSHMVSVLGDF